MPLSTACGAFSGFALAAGSIAIATDASSALITYDGVGRPTSVVGLKVGSDYFDGTFQYIISFDAIYGVNGDGETWKNGNTIDSAAAASAMRDALNEDPIQPRTAVVGVAFPTSSSPSAWGANSFTGLVGNDPYGAVSPIVRFRIDSASGWGMPSFTASSVPEPSSLALLGLGALAAAQRRRRPLNR